MSHHFVGCEVGAICFTVYTKAHVEQYTIRALTWRSGFRGTGEVLDAC